MRRRMGRPGLVGTMARTAVVVGTANAVTAKSQQKQAAAANAQQSQAAAQQAAFQAQADTAEMQAQLAAMQAQLAAQQMPPPAAPAAAAPAPAPAPAAPAAGGNDMMAQLQQLADMRANGLLSDDEFAAAKARLLAG